MQRTPIVENVFCHTHKQFHRMLQSHVTVVNPDSSDEPTLPERALQTRALPVTLIQYPQNVCSARLKKFSLQKLNLNQKSNPELIVFCAGMQTISELCFKYQDKLKSPLLSFYNPSPIKSKALNL